MEKTNSEDFKSLINNAGIAFMGIPVKESMNYMPYGVQIRDSLYTKAMEILNNSGYQKVILSDLVDPDSLTEIDKVSKVSSGYMRIENKNLMIAAGHEMNAYIYIKELLKHGYQHADLPVKIYNFGPVYRTNKNTKFPFNLGERKSFLECYSVFKTKEDAEMELEFATNWNRMIIKELLHIPSVEVVRPPSTNKKISKKTICIDSITPLEETVITGMTYFHDDIFTKSVNLKYKDQVEKQNKLAYSIHFGLSENILFSYLLNSCDGKNLRLYSFIAPIQVNILNALNDDGYDNDINNLNNMLKENNIRYMTEKIIRKKINSKLVTNTLQGIPVTILLKKEHSDIEIYSISNGIKELIAITNNINTCLIKILNIIVTLFDKNDKKIREDMDSREKESIVECDNLNELDEIVKKGKIAKIHLKNTDESVAIVESYLTGGEVLGFGLKKEYGRDIITQEDVDTIAFVSRRS
ncbi:MAG: hypothetical protein HFJ17_00190 [Clostridia bacterium]|nr:hypothetical protein [Clostridia bacterium]